MNYFSVLLNILSKQTSKIIIFYNVHKTLSNVKTGEPESLTVTYTRGMNNGYMLNSNSVQIKASRTKTLVKHNPPTHDI